MAAGDEPAARVASRGKSPFSLEAGVEGDTRLGADGQCPDGDVLRQEQINGILVTRLGPGIREIEELFTRMMALTKLPGAAFVLCYQGRLVYAAGFGYSDLEKRIPFTPYTPCEIGSVSKPLASMSILRLVDTGVSKLSDRPLTMLGWRPSNPNAGQWFHDVTVRHCLNHEMIFNKFPLRREDCAPLVGKSPDDVTIADTHKAAMESGLAFAPGTKSQYSGQGISVLARLYEKIGGVRFHEATKAMFEAIGIQDAFCFNYEDEGKNSTIPPSYGYEATTGEWKPSPWWEFRETVGSGDSYGAWVMSPLSLARFGDRFLDLYRDPARMSDLIINNRSDKNGGYALGWMIGKLADGQVTLVHPGVIGGWRVGISVGSDGFTSALIFNADDRRNCVLGHALSNPVPDNLFTEYQVPKETIPPSLQNILPNLLQKGRINNINLWRQAGFPD
ncbi:MAG: beta-lactamase family protein [Chthonomonadales bacterium]|nr:beta-lactamase family protein [Chthonomonadales bacterium]